MRMLVAVLAVPEVPPWSATFIAWVYATSWRAKRQVADLVTQRACVGANGKRVRAIPSMRMELLAIGFGVH